MLGASLAGAVYTVMARRLLVTRSALFVTAFQNLFGALFMAPLAALEAATVGVRTPTAAAVAAVLYLALLGSVVAYLLLNYGLRFVSAGRAAAFTNVMPVIAVGAALRRARGEVHGGAGAGGGRGAGRGVPGQPDGRRRWRG